jgi:hypothetical protein
MILTGKRGPSAELIAGLHIHYREYLAWLLTGEDTPFVVLNDKTLFLNHRGNPIKEHTQNLGIHSEVISGEETERRDKPAVGTIYNKDSLPENNKYSDLLQMTREILSSKTDYAESLAANIRSFHKSVKLENQINGQSSKSDSRIKSLEEKCEQFLEELTELKKSVKNKNSQCRQAPEESQNTEKKAM